MALPRIESITNRCIQQGWGLSKRVFEKSRFCHISPTMFPHSSFQTAGANPGPRTVSLDLPGLFKHPLRVDFSVKTLLYVFGRALYQVIQPISATNENVPSPGDRLFHVRDIYACHRMGGGSISFADKNYTGRRTSGSRSP